jgi:hypothetical protein
VHGIVHLIEEVITDCCYAVGYILEMIHHAWFKKQSVKYIIPFGKY